MADWAGMSGDIISAGINAYAGSAASKTQYKYTKKLMEAQQAWAEHAARHAHQWEVEDLRAAGLNPLLSIDTSGAVAHTPGTPSISAPDYGTVDFTQSAKYLSGEKKRERELQELLIANAKKQGKSIDAETAKKGAETARIFKHIAEGVGTPQQTKHVIYNVVGDLISKGSNLMSKVRDTEEEVTKMLNNELRYQRMKKDYERRQK